MYRSRQTHPELIEDYFENINTPEKAYWLGFLYADGCIARDKKTNKIIRFALYLSIKDESWVDKFINTIKVNINKKVYTKLNLVGIAITNKIFTNNLINNGCHPKKAFTIKFPNFSTDELEMCFLLGYFDGDGSSVGSSSTITSGSKEFLMKIKEKYDISSRLQEYKTKKGNSFYRINIGRSFLEMLQSVYKDSMPRKRI